MAILTHATQSNYSTKFLNEKYIPLNYTVQCNQYTVVQVQQYIDKYITHYTLDQQNLIIEFIHHILTHMQCKLTNDEQSIKLNTLHNIVIQHILHTVHTAQHKDNDTNINDLSSRVLQHYDDLVIQHSVYRPPYSIAIFSMSDIKLIAEYYDNCITPHIIHLLYAFMPMPYIDTVSIESDLISWQSAVTTDNDVISNKSKTKRKSINKTTPQTKT